MNSPKRSEAVHIVVAEGVVGLIGVNDEQSRSPEITRTFWLCLKELRLECTTKRLSKVRTFWSRFIGRKFNSLKRGEAVHVVVTVEVVGLVGVDNERSGPPERALRLVITNRLKVRTFWSRLIERKLNSLKGGEVVQVVVASGVVSLRRVDEEQAGSREKALRLIITKSKYL